ncbi:hypothetical protein [Variovorax sp. KK3]|uniref:hypothetical protein n=1 Tax=Variovorax sp. KK3 TaxID=1855728 RepID=UPI00097C5354|nr:hypothetical protein [Variovorax sp. KK3]
MRALRPVLFSLVLAFFALAAASQPSQRLDITGAVRDKLSLDVAALAAFAAPDIGQFTQTRSGQGTETRSTVRGVKLAALVERAGLSAPGPNDWKNLVVVATATDGYRAVFSWPEISNTAVGDGVLVLFERDGRALDAREGGIALLSAADRRLGPRHVRNLVRIEVRALD